MNYGQNFISNNGVSHNDGYPLCGFASSPAGCGAKMNRPWGQVAGCTAAGFMWPFDNVASYYRIACDMSGGHSGSPNRTDDPGENGPYVIGIASGNIASSATAVRTRRETGRRTQWLPWHDPLSRELHHGQACRLPLATFR